jgi:hypothetical protein
MQTKTIATTFDPASLPTWAQAHPEVVQLCSDDLAYRCDVCATVNKGNQSELVRTAKRRAAEYAAYLAGITDPRD